MTQKFKILVTRKWPKKVEESLVTTFDTTLNVEDKPLSESELIEAMKSYDALLPTVTDPITDKIISTPDRKHGPVRECKSISCIRDGLLGWRRWCLSDRTTHG